MVEDVEEAVNSTDFWPGNTETEYDDGHIHLALHPDPKWWWELNTPPLLDPPYPNKPPPFDFGPGKIDPWEIDPYEIPVPPVEI